MKILKIGNVIVGNQGKIRDLYNLIDNFRYLKFLSLFKKTLK